MGLSGRVPAYALTSLTSKEEAASAMAALTAAAAPAGKPKGGPEDSGAADRALLLYVTPEKIVASKRLMAKLEKVYQVRNKQQLACRALQREPAQEAAYWQGLSGSQLQ